MAIIGGDEQVMENLVAARAELRIVRLLPKRDVMPDLRPKMLLRTTLRRTLVKFGPTSLSVEIIPVHQKVVAGALTAIAFACVGVAARIMNGMPVSAQVEMDRR